MAPVDVSILVAIFVAAKKTLSKGRDAVIAACFNAVGIPIGEFVAWVVGKILDFLKFDATKLALSIATVLEYAKRTGSFQKGLRLQNHCSVCGMKGHNKQNHSQPLDRFLKIDAGLDSREDVSVVSSALESCGF
eukprot:1178047-Prorocentrum_minimum.AAC.1